MNLTKDIEIIDLCLKIGNTLIIADIHIGYEEALNKQGILIPRFQFKETAERIEKILKNNKFDKIIVNGDLKHEFGEISETEWRHTLRILELLGRYCKEIILIKGNHDTILGPIAKKKNLKVLEHYVIDDVYICHGDKIPNNSEFKKSKTIIIGHEHAAIGIAAKLRREIYKCFLVGKYKKKTLIAMPSFNLVTEGTDVLKEKLLSPFLQQSLKEFDVYIAGEEALYFGKIKDIDKLAKTFYSR